MYPENLPYSRVSFTGGEDSAKEIKSSSPSRCDAGRDTFPDLEFLHDIATDTIPADEFSNNGKLVPVAGMPIQNHRRPERARRQSFAGNAGSCTRRWGERIGLRKLHQTATSNLLHRSLRSNGNDDGNLPLLKNVDFSSHGYLEDQPRLSSDSDKDNTIPGPNPFMRIQMQRKGDGFSEEALSGARPSMESPRMNASGKIVFQTLERNSSIPGSFNSGPRGRHVEAERKSYSANVRVTQVINVPVMSFRGSSRTGSVFGLFSSSPQKNSGKFRADR